MILIKDLHRNALEFRAIDHFIRRQECRQEFSYNVKTAFILILFLAGCRGSHQCRLGSKQGLCLKIPYWLFDSFVWFMTLYMYDCRYWTISIISSRRFSRSRLHLKSSPMECSCTMEPSVDRHSTCSIFSSFAYLSFHLASLPALFPSLRFSECSACCDLCVPSIEPKD